MHFLWKSKSIMSLLSLPDAIYTSSSTQKNNGLGWLLLFCLVAGVVFPLTLPLAGLQDGDGLLTAMISTQKLTWYFWGQDRFLNFLPALASPIPDVIWNLRFQIFLRAFATFIGPLAVLCLFTRSLKVLTLAVVLTNTFLVFFSSDYALFNLYVQHNPFGTSLALFALAVALFQWRFNVVTALFIFLILFCAYATNIALMTIMLPVLCLAWYFGSEPRANVVKFLVINMAAVGVALWHSRRYGSPHATQYGLSVSSHALLEGFKTIAENTHLIGWAVVAVIGMLSAWYLRPKASYFIYLVMIGCVLLLPLMSCTAWVQMNGFNIRYYLCYILIAGSCLSYLISWALLRAVKDRPLVPVACTVLLVGCVDFGLHGISPDYAELIGGQWRAQAKAVAKAAVNTDSKLIIGDFWHTWPAVFAANAERYREAPQLGQIYGVTFRAAVVRKKVIRDLGGRPVRAICLLEDPQACADMVKSEYRLISTTMRLNTIHKNLVGSGTETSLVLEINP